MREEKKESKGRAKGEQRKGKKKLCKFSNFKNQIGDMQLKRLNRGGYKTMARGSLCSCRCIYGDEIGNLSNEKGLF